MIWERIKYIADENIDREVTGFFRKEGYDFTDVYEENICGSADRLIIEKAKQSNRIIITHDVDFGHIVFVDKTPFTGIIYLQPGHIKSRFTIQSIQKLFQSDIELVQPFMIVVEHKLNEIKIRVRNSIS
jgi:predicted nuclease of predicted toxin-antitoxin system